MGREAEGLVMETTERVARALSLRNRGTENAWRSFLDDAMVAIDATGDGWLPIDTCPPFEFNPELWFQDGPRYLLFVGYAVIGSYGYTKKGKGRWSGSYGIIRPTHWMPLPEPPK
jgi:hypothetical protein